MSEFWLCFNCCIAEQPQPKRRRRIDRSMIGEPTNFVHTGHVGSGDLFSGMNSVNSIQNQMQSKGGYGGEAIPVNVQLVDTKAGQRTSMFGSFCVCVSFLVSLLPLVTAFRVPHNEKEVMVRHSSFIPVTVLQCKKYMTVCWSALKMLFCWNNSAVPFSSSHRLARVDMDSMLLPLNTDVSMTFFFLQVPVLSVTMLFLFL